MTERDIDKLIALGILALLFLTIGAIVAWHMWSTRGPSGGGYQPCGPVPRRDQSPPPPPPGGTGASQRPMIDDQLYPALFTAAASVAEWHAQLSRFHPGPPTIPMDDHIDAIIRATLTAPRLRVASFERAFAVFLEDSLAGDLVLPGCDPLFRADTRAECEAWVEAALLACARQAALLRTGILL